MTDRDAACPFDAEPRRKRTRQNRQIFPVEHRPQIALCRTEALSIPDIEIRRGRTFVAWTVGILDDRDAKLCRPVDQRCRQWVHRAAARDPQRPAGTAPFARTPFPVFPALEIG